MNRLKRLANWYLPLTVVAALLLAAVSVERLDPLRHYIHPAASDLDQSFWEFTRRNGHCDSNTVIVAGSSVAREAFDAERMTARLGRPTFNFAFSNAQLVDVEQALKLCPGVGTVVLGVNGFSFDERMKRDPRLPWNQPPGPYLIVRRAELAALVEHRARRLARLLTHHPKDDVAEGKAVRLYHYTGRMGEAELSQEMTDMYRGYPDDGQDHTATNFAALDRIAERLSQAGTKLLVVWLPELPEAEWPPFDRTHSQLAAHTLKGNARLLDLASMSFPPESYHDFHHVLGPARDRLTDLIADGLMDPSP